MYTTVQPEGAVACRATLRRAINDQLQSTCRRALPLTLRRLSLSLSLYLLISQI